MLQLRVLLYELFDLLFEDLHFLPHCIHQVTLYQILKCRTACALGKHRSGPGVPARPAEQAADPAMKSAGASLCPGSAVPAGAVPHRAGSRLSPPTLTCGTGCSAAPPPPRPRPPARRLQPVLGAGCRISLPPAVRARPRVTSERGAANGRPSYL